MFPPDPVRWATPPILTSEVRFFPSSLARNWTPCELSTVSGSRTHSPSAGLVLLGGTADLPFPGVERASVNTLRFSFIRSNPVVFHEDRCPGCSPAQSRSPWLRGTQWGCGPCPVRTQSASRLMVGFHPAAPCASAGRSTSSPTPRVVGEGGLSFSQRVTYMSSHDKGCDSPPAPIPPHPPAQERRGRAESPTPLGTNSRPQTFSPFSAPRGRQ